MGSSTYILRVLILWFEGHSDTEWQGSAVKIQSWSNWSPPVFTLMMCWYLPSNTWEALERGRVQAADSTLLWWEYKYELHHMPRSHVTCLLSSLVSLVLYHPFWSFWLFAGYCPSSCRSQKCTESQVAQSPASVNSEAVVFFLPCPCLSSDHQSPADRTSSKMAEHFWTNRNIAEL